MGSEKGKGQPKKIESPDHLLSLWEQYKAWADNNPLVYTETTKTPKGDIVKTINHRLAWTWQGFDTWLFNNGVIHSTKDYKSNTKGDYSDYSSIITYIGEEMYSQKFAGAASGLYNANIIARDLGLVDKKQTEKVKSGMSKEEILKRLDELRKGS